MTRALSRLVSVGKQRLTTCQKVFVVRSQSTAASAAAARSDQGLLKDDPKLWVKSPYPDVPTVVGIEMHELLYSQISRWPGHLPAFECGVTGKKISFAELYRHSRGFGAALIKAGFKPGDIIGVVLPNIPEFSVILLGCWSAGLTVSCVNPAYTSDEIKRQLKSSDAKCAVTIEYFLDAVRTAKADNPELESIIVIGDAMEGCHTYSEMIKCDTNGVEFSSGSKRNRDTQQDVALLPYSSGTTGPPKGVVLTHTNLTTNLMQFVAQDVGVTQSYEVTQSQERLIGLLPFFHSYGNAAFLVAGVYLGVHTLTLPRFDPKTFLDAIRSHKPTTLQLVTPLISHIVHSDEYTAKEFESISTIVGAAAPIGQVLIEKILERAGKYLFFAEGYGMTELSPLSHFLNPSTKNTKIGSCGRCVPSTTSKIVDTKTGETLGPNCNGELLVKGPQIMKGYYKNEEATRNTINSEGWLATGDIARYSEDGFFYIVDRLKELIKVKGFQVAPSELEDILRKHDKIQDVAVIGVPDEESGEVPRAYIVKQDASLSPQEVHSYLKPILASFKQLKGGIEFRESIPKAPSGKILRRELSEDYKKNHS